MVLTEENQDIATLWENIRERYLESTKTDFVVIRTKREEQISNSTWAKCKAKTQMLRRVKRQASGKKNTVLYTGR